jgi:hypothetical protein
MLGKFITGRLVVCLGILLAFAAFAPAQAPASVTVLPNTVTAGTSTTGYVALVAPAKSKETISLSSSSTGVKVPSSVTVAAGSQTASFSITTTTNKTAVVTLTASGSGGSAVGFMMIQAATVTIPSFSGMTFTPTLALSGQTITGTITFKSPILIELTFDLSSASANFSVPASVTALPGATAVGFKVTPGSGAVTGAFSVTATLAPGAYQNAWTGPTSETGSFAYLAGVGLPANYAGGFWVAPPLGVGPSEFVPTLTTSLEGGLSFGGPTLSLNSGTWSYDNDSGYDISARVGAGGQVRLESNPFSLQWPVYAQNLFPVFGTSNATPPYGWSYLFDNSTLTFSKDGKTATLKVIGQPYTWTLSANPTITFGAPVTLGTYIFARVQ